MTECIFCKIVAGQIPAHKIYEDADCLAFKDIYPKASVHILVIPKAHIVSLQEVDEAHIPLLGRLSILLNKIAKEAGLDNGFRTIINAGPGGHQEVPHLHYHILGGGRLPGF
jgi:histidine triad (HIT) family protein